MFCILLVLIISLQIHSIESALFYITPDSADNGSCLFNNSTLKPCYQLHQVNNLYLSNESSLTLYLLPGKHELLVQQSFIVYNMSVVEINSWNEFSEVEIFCPWKAQLIFFNVQNINIFSIKFNTCTVLCAAPSNLENSSKQNHSLFIDRCIFTSTKEFFALNIKNLNFTSVNNCTFVSNNQAIRCNRNRQTTHYHSRLRVINSRFLYNWVNRNGGALLVYGVDLEVSGSEFIGNSAKFGGAIYSTSYFVAENTTFKRNYANESGGAIYMENYSAKMSNCHFEYNSGKRSGGAIFLSINFFPQYITSIINSTFTFNRAIYGGAVYCASDVDDQQRSTVIMRNGNSTFNSAHSGGFIYLLRFNLHLDQTFLVKNNTAFSNGGAILADNSYINIDGSFTVAYNKASNKGGALYLGNYSKIMLNQFLGRYRIIEIRFDSNMVTSPHGQGGAIYIEDRDCKTITHPDHECFVFNYLETESKEYFLFTNNVANQGSVLYGGLLDRCLPPEGFQDTHFRGIDMFKRISEYEQGSLQITSDPIKVCTFNVDILEPDCNKQVLNVTKMKGGIISIPLVVLDQNDIPVKAIVRAGYRELTADLGKGESRKEIANQWGMFQYHVFTTHSSAILIMEPEGICRGSPLSSLTIHISIIPCSPGFEEREDRCICDRRLSRYLNISACYLETHSIERVGPIWLRYDEEYLKMHTNCPLDYCLVMNDIIRIAQPDQQCANERSGILCGACQENHSIALGTSKCLKCSSKFSFVWLTVVFAGAGLALVAFLLVCSITISTGTLNGLNFYCNVVSISGLLSLHDCSINPILNVFIAWVNLELGIQTCFYPGLNTYQKTWLQFAFPLYIWTLVAIITVASYYSSKAMRLFGRNNIAILATLFILSYNKILKTIVTALSFTQVSVSRADDVTAPVVSETVWTADGNTAYLKGKHAALFVVALLFLLILFLPYTLLILFGQCVRTIAVRRRALHWLRSTAFISILDAYHAPYNRRHRYWTGLMLLTRCLLVIIFTSSYTENAVLTNMYAVTLVVSGVLVIKIFTTQIYKNQYVSILELCFLLNLEILSSTLCYLKGRVGSERIICRSVSASISMSFIMFVCILAYHAYLQVKKTRFYMPIRQQLFSRWQSSHGPNIPLAADYNPRAVKTKPPTTTTVELREPLLDN